MPTYFDIGEATTDRLAAALAFILEGRAVGFGDYSLAVAGGFLRIDVDYPWQESNHDFALRSIGEALRKLEAMVEQQPPFKEALGGLPRRVSLIYSYGMGDIEIAELVDGQLSWKQAGNP